MAKQPETFFDFDITKYLGDMKVPGVDVEGLLASQQKNLEALTAANKMAFEGMQAIFKRQAEIIRQSMEEAAVAAKDFSTADSPQAKLNKQTELAKDGFEKAVSNMRELAEMMAKSNGEVFNLLNTRIAEAMEEAKGLVAQQQAAAAKMAPKAAGK